MPADSVSGDVVSKCVSDGMKFSLFTEIQCPAGAVPVARLDEFLEQAALADALGFRGFWIAEIHCQPAMSLLSAPYAVLGAASQITKRLRLGVAVNTLPVHHPVQLAEQAATLDLISHGRMDFAAGGGHPHSRVYECFGADHQATHEIVEESLKVIEAAWTEEVLSFDGRFFKIPGVIVNPKPLQKPHPPFYIAASSREGVELAARMGVNLFLPIHTRTREQVAGLAHSYWEGLTGHDHAAAERELGLLVPMHLAGSAKEAEARAREGIMSYYRTIAEMRKSYVDWLSVRGAPLPPRLLKTATGDLTFERVLAEHAVVGGAETALAALRELGVKTRATHILAWMNIGGVPHSHVLESMERFARDVLPRLGD
jgi:alkanesulfonate monooxygenase SsuD/methylene tetrahydromethanopterin reductase-like flavin-dependent oxidoreductase (luciferase family)